MIRTAPWPEGQIVRIMVPSTRIAGSSLPLSAEHAPGHGIEARQHRRVHRVPRRDQRLIERRPAAGGTGSRVRTQARNHGANQVARLVGIIEQDLDDEVDRYMVMAGMPAIVV